MHQRSSPSPLTLRSPAKVNLTLDVLGKDPSGYHRIQTIFHEVPELFDTLTFTPLDSPTVELHGDRDDIPWDTTNTIHRAATRLLATHAPNRGIRIDVHKKIPPGSGLGGGASNAATTLKALNELWQLGLTREQLLTHAAAIGMDVAFFILGGCALGMHYGEQLMPLPTLQTVPGYEQVRIEIIHTGVSVATQEAYASVDLVKSGKAGHETSQLVKTLKGEKAGNVEPLFHNDFEAVFFKNHPLLKTQHTKAHLAGTGGSLWRAIAG